MPAKKKSKEPLDFSKLYALYYLSVIPRNERLWNQTYVQMGSFDPAIVNLGVNIERRMGYADGSVTLETLLLERKNFKIGASPLLEETPSLTGEEEIAGIQYRQILYLESIQEYLLGCHILIIENQLSTINPLITRIFQHILTWLQGLARRSPCCPDIYVVSPKLAKKVLGLEEKGKKVKTEMVLRMRAICASYKDEVAQQNLNAPGKNDDRADARAQCEALARLLNLPHILC